MYGLPAFSWLEFCRHKANVFTAVSRVDEFKKHTLSFSNFTSENADILTSQRHLQLILQAPTVDQQHNNVRLQPGVHTTEAINQFMVFTRQSSAPPLSVRTANGTRAHIMSFFFFLYGTFLSVLQNYNTPVVSVTAFSVVISG